MTGALTTGRWLLAFPERLERLLAGRWFPVAVNLAAFLFLGISMAQWGIRLLQLPAGPTHSIAREYREQAVFDVNLFGSSATPVDLAEQPLDGIPVTSLNLVLSGVVETGNGNFALFSANGAPEVPFTVGQELMTGVTLHTVLPDRAIIARAGALETVMLKNAVATASPRRALTVASPRAPRKDEPVAVQREQVLAHLQSPEVLRQASIVPNASGGFLVRSMKPGSVYEKLGLHTGDVIRGVNGEQINSLSDALKLYARLRSGDAAGPVTVEVSRAGRTETLQYHLQ